MSQGGLSNSSARIHINNQGITLHFQGPVTIVLGNSHINQSKGSSSSRLLIRYQRRLQKLKEKEALFGINTPPEILMEIENLEEKIVALWSE